MIDISRGFIQVCLLDDFAQTSSENLKLLRFSIKVLTSLSKKYVNLKISYDLPPL
jgi:hypothetical protein